MRGGGGGAGSSTFLNTILFFHQRFHYGGYFEFILKTTCVHAFAQEMLNEVFKCLQIISDFGELSKC